MKYLRCVVFVLLTAFFACGEGFAQDDGAAQVGDSAFVKTHGHKRGGAEPMVENVHTTDSILQKKHNPKVAVALSAVLPGAGQIYNKRWWKVPIIYAGFGASVYFICRFSHRMVIYRTEYRNRMQEHFDLLDPTLSNYDDESVLSMKKYYQRNMEIAVAATAIIYVLNLIDAAVDAHLFYFDISDDLSLQFAPYLQPSTFSQPGSMGLTFAFHLK